MAKKFLLASLFLAITIVLAGCTFLNSSTHTLSGYVKDVLGNAASGVKIEVSYPNGYKVTYTDKNGYWSESGVIGETTITPEATAWTFNPPTKSLYVDKSENNVNFTANPVNYWVSGYVKDKNGNGLSGVTITFESSQSTAISVKTDLNGYWKSDKLKGTVEVKPLKNGWLFNPTEVQVDSLKNDVNFTASKGVGETLYIPLKGSPAGLAVDDKGGRLFVANSSTNLVMVYDVYGYDKLYEYKAGPSPESICYDEKDNRLFVANSSTDTVTVIEAASSPSKVKVKEILIGGTPQGIAYDANNNCVYVTNSYYNAVSVLSASPTRIVATIRIGKPVNDIAVNSVTNMIYVTSKSDGSVSVINGKDNTLSDTIKINGMPVGVAVNEFTNEIYVADAANNTLDVIDGNTDEISKRVKVGNSPSHVYIDTQKNIVYVSNNSDNTLSVLDGKTNSVIQSVIVGKGPSWVSGDDKIGSVYVSNSTEKTISVIH